MLQKWWFHFKNKARSFQRATVWENPTPEYCFSVIEEKNATITVMEAIEVYS